MKKALLRRPSAAAAPTKRRGADIKTQKKKQQTQKQPGIASAEANCKSAEDLVRRAGLARTAGRYAESENCLRRGIALVSAGPYARVAAYDLALLLLQLGRGDEVNGILHGIGFIYRLSSPIFNMSSGTSHGKKGVVAAFDGALPELLLRPLQRAFAAKSCFWSEHRYPTPQFFSYNESLRVADAGPSSCSSLIREVAEYLRPIVERAFPELCLKAGRLTSVEWWPHLRESDGGHQLHWDLDEAGLHACPDGREPGHPLVSSVLYLSGSPLELDELAPTLVTDHRLSKGSSARSAWLCFPKLNRLLLFDGGLLHGVVPRLPSAASQTLSQASRLTLMIGWWGSKPSPACTPAPKLCSARGRSSRAPVLGPNMAIPEVGKSGFTWPRLLQNRKGSTATLAAPSHPPSSATLRGPISPVWVSSAGAGSRSSHGAAGRESGTNADVKFFGRWFLEHEPPRLQEMVIAEARMSAPVHNAAASPARTRSRSPRSKSRTVQTNKPAEVEEMSMAEFQRLRGMTA